MSYLKKVGEFKAKKAMNVEINSDEESEKSSIEEMDVD